MVMISPQINVSLVPGGDLAPWQGQALGEWAESHPGPPAPFSLPPAGSGGGLGDCQAFGLRS